MLTANEAVNMGQFGMMIGYYQRAGFAVPYPDYLFWFGDGVLNENDYLFVFTGQGTPTKVATGDGKSNLYSLHWGRDTTLFANNAIVPILFRMDAIQVAEGPDNQPQRQIVTAKPSVSRA
jgi:hypothetical protein